MSQIKENLSGRRFGSLLVIGLKKGIWECRCDCGRICYRDRCKLVSGYKTRPLKSCGCKMHWQKGLSVTPTGHSWANMVKRCFNKKDKSYKHYGGRGIRVCEFLSASIANLISVIGLMPDGLSIDRNNNDGHYSCGRCPECVKYNWPLNIRWATDKQQQRNTSTNHLLTIGGMTKCIAEWTEYANLPLGRVLYRLNAGWPKYALLAPASADLHFYK